MVIISQTVHRLEALYQGIILDSYGEMESQTFWFSNWKKNIVAFSIRCIHGFNQIIQLMLFEELWVKQR